MLTEIRASKLDTVLLEWKAARGDTVEEGSILCLVQLGNMKRTVTSKHKGTIAELKYGPGDAVPGGAAICMMDVEEEKPAEEMLSVPAGQEVAVMLPKAGSPRVKIKEWRKAPGDQVTAGEVIASVEAGKLSMEVISPYGGQLVRTAGAVNEEIGKDEAIAWILSDGTAMAAKKEEPKTKVLVIGGGPGGYVAAIRAAQLGGEVRLIEKEHLGGTCLNVGCIPTKALMHSAEIFETAKAGANAGVLADNVRLDWPKVQAYRESVSRQLVGGVKGLLAANGVEYTEGTAAFTGPKTVTVTKADGTREECTADKIIIATGSEPVMPPIPGVADNPDCINSTGALRLESLPASMVIIGGGVIGIELACAYAAFGTKITVVEMMDRIMPLMDYELTLEAQKLMEARGITFCLETSVLKVEKEDGRSKVVVRTKDGQETSIAADKILVATGRRSRIQGLETGAAGIQTERNHIVVNDKMETNVPGIYAIGDCAGRIMLAHTASAMGETAAENALGKNSLYNEHAVPSCVYMFPEFACVGMTEEQIKEKGYAYKTGKFPVAANGKSVIMEETDGWVKILADEKTGRILGVHILGPRATDLIAEATLAMQMHGKTEDLIHTIHSHPTVAEAIHEAALAVEGRAIHFK